MASTLYDEEPQPGDLIEISRDACQQWAVYVGEGYVVHLTSEGEGASGSSSMSGANIAVVKKEKLLSVVGDNEWKINNSLDKEYEPRQADVIVKKARAMVGAVLPYRIASQNCEKLANDLRYGKVEPRQADVIVREACAMVGAELPYGITSQNCENLANHLRSEKAESRQYDEEPQPGDLIEISRDACQQWAVYVGEGYVVHLTSEGEGASGSSSMSGANTGVVKKEKLLSVVGDCEWKINNSLDKKYEPRQADVIVREACAMVGDVQPYGIASQNCENLANHLRYGKAESRQVLEAGGGWIGGLLGAVGAGVVVLGAGVVYLLSRSRR